MKSLEIRQKFFDYFTRKEHTQVPSSSLIPAQDPTLLFTNAGMNQFKDIFLGKEQRSYKRAVSIQKCIRAGGKHNDLENVGRTKRHLTFFEMMGSFSFGDYFKEKAITLTWEFLTKTIKLDPKKLHISVFKDDDETYTIWHKKIGVPQERIARLDEKDNFWQMGETGPCGPCTEIHYDRGITTPKEEHLKLGDECERYLEIWNLVFMQYNRQDDGSLVELTNKGVDTGMGLERLCSVIQNTDTVYETDIFMDIISAIEKHCNKQYKDADQETTVAFRVLADHIRSTCLAIADGGMPSNEGRGYVIRKIIRRAALFAQKLKHSMLFADLADDFIQQMGSIYPELVQNKELITSILRSEIEKFSTNLEKGQAILQEYLAESKKTQVISGSQAFTLYDTYGFPLELTSLVAHEAGYSVDEHGFEKEMERQRAQSRQDTKTHATPTLPIKESITTEFVGYTQLETNSPVLALVQDDKAVSCVEPHQNCWLVTAQTPVYVECGGQITDQAIVRVQKQECTVQDVQKVGNAIALAITAPTKICLHETITVAVDEALRINTTRNHTATHLLQAALIEVLGPQVKQAGSLVTSEQLRFDFTHHKNISDQEIKAIEHLVNDKITKNIPVITAHMTYKQAIEKGVRAIFGEKYNPENVRAVIIDDFSSELCGGTHVQATGEIGSFKITSNNSLSTGIRRMTAVTGKGSLELYQKTFAQLKELSHTFKVQLDEVIYAVEKQTNSLKEALLQIKQLKQQAAQARIPEIIAQLESINGIPFVGVNITNTDIQELRELGQNLIQRKEGLYLLTTTHQDTALFVIAAPKALSTKINLKDLMNTLKEAGYKGGGSPQLMQGKGPAHTPVKEIITSWINTKE